MQRAAQIVMLRKTGPTFFIAAQDFELNAGAPKTPPRQFAGRHIENPIGLEPIDDVVMTGERDETLLDEVFANAVGDRGGGGFSDRSIDDARKFVENNEFRRRVEERASEFAAEFFAVAERRERLRPTRRRPETDRRQHADDLLHRTLAETVDRRAVGRPIGAAENFGRVNLLRDGTFAAAGGADDKADSPIFVETRRRFERNDFFRFGFDRRVEHTGERANSERIVNRRREAKRLRFGGIFQRLDLSEGGAKRKKDSLKVDDATLATGSGQLFETLALLGFVRAFDDDLKQVWNFDFFRLF